MKKQVVKDEAEAIGNNSFELINFVELPDTATAQEQIDALRADQRWQEHHNIEISQAIDRLIQLVEDDADVCTE